MGYSWVEGRGFLHKGGNTMKKLDTFVTAYQNCTKDLAIMRTVYLNLKKQNKRSNRLWFCLVILTSILSFLLGKACGG